jgi:hypothetical protein
MSVSKIVFSFVLLGVAATAAGSALGTPTSAKAPRTMHSRISVPVDRIVVRGTVGRVWVTAGGRSDIDVTQTTNWWNLFVPGPVFRQYVSRGSLYLRSSCETWCSVDYDVRAPAGMAVVVRRGAADVQVRGRPGDVVLATRAGSLLVDLERAPRRIDVETGVGSVDVRVPRGAYAVHSRTGLGEQTIRGLIQNHRATQTIRVRTVVGNVSIAGR